MCFICNCWKKLNSQLACQTIESLSVKWNPFLLKLIDMEDEEQALSLRYFIVISTKMTPSSKLSVCMKDRGKFFAKGYFHFVKMDAFSLSMWHTPRTHN